MSSGDKLKIKDDCLVATPTIFISVPRIYNRIAEALQERFRKETGLKKCLIDSALDSKMKNAK